MQSVLLVVFFLFYGFAFSQTDETLFYQETGNKLAFSFKVNDIKEILKNEDKLSPESVLMFNAMIDSISNTDSKKISDNDILKYRKETTDYIIFDHAIYTLIKDRKVEFTIENNVISPKDLKIKKRFITCCNSLPRIFNNAGCCSKRYVFYYKSEIAGTLYIKWFPRVINCF